MTTLRPTLLTAFCQNSDEDEFVQKKLLEYAELFPQLARDDSPARSLTYRKLSPPIATSMAATAKAGENWSKKVAGSLSFGVGSTDSGGGVQAATASNRWRDTHCGQHATYLLVVISS